MPVQSDPSDELMKRSSEVLTVEQLSPNLVGVLQLLQETTVFLHTLDTERLVLGTDTVDQVVVVDGDFLVLLVRLGRIPESDRLLRRVDIGRLSLVDGALSLLVSGDISRRLDDGSSFQGTDSDGRQQGREQEVVSGRDDDDVVILVVQALQKRGGTPTVTQDDDGLLLGVLVELLSGVEILLTD